MIRGLLSALFLVGCASGMDDQPVLIGMDLSDEYVTTAALRGADEWNSCGYRQIYVVALGSEHSIPLTIVDGVLRGDGSTAGGVTHISEKKGPLDIEVVRSNDPEVMRITIEHEMGHTLLGPQHYGDTGTLMAANRVLKTSHVTSDLCNILKDH